MEGVLNTTINSHNYILELDSKIIDLGLKRNSNFHDYIHNIIMEFLGLSP